MPTRNPNPQKTRKDNIRLVLTLTPEQSERISLYANAMTLTRQQFVLFCVTTAMQNAELAADAAQISLFAPPQARAKSTAKPKK